MPIVAIDIDQISYGRNRRPVNQEKVEELKESIKANGLLNPITVDQNLNLIAGLHRLTACKLLKLEQIQCNIITYEDAVHARLAEIDENLIRSELSVLERAQLCSERERILEQMGIRARPGDNQYTHKGSETISPTVKTTFALAKELGYTERTFQQSKQIARDIAPEVQELINGTPIVNSTTALLKIARAGKKEREKAEKAEKAAHEAKDTGKLEEAERQALLAASSRAKLRELQLVALRTAIAEKEAKLTVQKQEKKKSTSYANVFTTQPGDQWLLERHLVYYGDTSSDEFIDCLPSNAALAIATPSATWNHDYLVNEARVVAVVRKEGYIHGFCSRHQMPFRFEFLIGDLYVAIFSRQSIHRPEKPTIEGLEGIVTYLISLYTEQSNFVIAPSVGNGEVLIACERLRRICFAGEENPQMIGDAIVRWQNLSQKRAEKIG